MNKIEKLAFGIVALECIGFSIARRAFNKRNRELMQKYYGVNNIDEFLKKREEEFYKNRNNIVEG